MSKFTDLCDAYRMSRQNYFAYRDECYSFASKLMTSYKKYLDIPETQFKLIPTHEKPEKGATYSIFGAMDLNDDTFWHFGLQITLYEAPNTYPHQPLLITFRFKKIRDGIFLVKISDEDKGHEIYSDNDSNFNNFFEFLQERIRDHFENGLQRFLEKSATLRVLGFNP